MHLTPPLIAAALALSISGCAADGAGPGPTAPQNASTPAAPSVSTTASSSEGQAAAAPEGESPSSTPTDTGKPFDPEEFTSRLTAAVEENPTVRIDVQVQLDAVSATARGVQDLERNALDMDVDLGGQQLGYRLIDGRYYLAQPPKWVPVTKDSDNALIRSTLEQIQILSMRNQLDAFVVGVEAAGVKGEEEVGGTTTTHYTATVDAEKALTELGMDRDPSTPESVVYDVWLDDEDLIRKMSFTQNGATATMTASDWGGPITIEKPKPSELAAAP